MTNDDSHPQAGSTGTAATADPAAMELVARSRIAADIERGVMRMFMAQGIAAVSELPLPDGRRADVVGLSPDGLVTVVEIKSSIADFRCDQKWPDYRAYCDRLFFAVAPAFPVDILPADTGLILADKYGAGIERDAPRHPIAAARRKVMMLRFGRAAAARLARLRDPGNDGLGEF